MSWSADFAQAYGRDAFASCTPQHDTTRVCVVDTDGALIDDATDRDVVEWLRTDGAPILIQDRIGVIDGKIGSLATIEWHCYCDPDACPLGATGYVTHDIDARDPEIQIACDAIKESRIKTALKIFRHALGAS